MEIPTDSMYVITYDKIITMTEVKEGQMIEFYTRYLDDEDVDFTEDGRVKPDTKMGYISSVKEARRMLEKIYNNKEDSKES